MTKLRPSGFTLIEILVAVVIISVVLGVALIKMNFDSPESKLKQESARLARTMQLADQEAIFQSREIGLLIQDNDYEYLLYDEKKWVPLDDALLKKRSIPEEMEVTLNIDGITVDTSPVISDNKTPQIVFYSNGEWTSFEIILKPSDSYDLAYTLSNIKTGTLEVERESN